MTLSVHNFDESKSGTDRTCNAESQYVRFKGCKFIENMLSINIFKSEEKILNSRLYLLYFVNVLIILFCFGCVDYWISKPIDLNNVTGTYTPTHKDQELLVIKSDFSWERIYHYTDSVVVDKGKWKLGTVAIGDYHIQLNSFSRRSPEWSESVVYNLHTSNGDSAKLLEWLGEDLSSKPSDCYYSIYYEGDVFSIIVDGDHGQYYRKTN